MPRHVQSYGPNNPPDFVLQSAVHESLWPLYELCGVHPDNVYSVHIDTEYVTLVVCAEESDADKYALEGWSGGPESAVWVKDVKVPTDLTVARREAAGE